MQPSATEESLNSPYINVIIAIALFSMAVMAYGGWIAILQVYFWLKTDHWYQVSLLTLFSADATTHPDLLSKWLPGFDPSSSAASWLVSPKEWLGIHRVVHSVLNYLGVGYTLTIGTWFVFMGISILLPEPTKRRSKSHSQLS